ncbi:hypothetical protein DFH09DRAFT_1276918 [Mycena vulgaris]|nr:hypothetical protein DFH09DRAFT_1276918 [Mycena vulgaris]
MASEPQEKPANSDSAFNPEDVQNVRHTKIGIWDFYEQIEPKLKMVPWSLRAKMETYHEIKGSFPFVVRMFKDIGSIGRGWYSLFGGYVLITVLLALIPAIELWYSGLLLKIVQNAVEKRSVDHQLLFRVAASRLICAAITRLLDHCQRQLYNPLTERTRQHYAVQKFHVRARLDVPTYADAVIQRQLDNSDNGSESVAWRNIMLQTVEVFSLSIQLVSQFSVLVNMLRDQRDVWAATTNDPHYLRSAGMSRVVYDQRHRKELVAGGLADYMSSTITGYREAADHLGIRATDFFQALHSYRSTDRLRLTGFLSDPLRELPQIVFTLRAV